MRRLHKPIGLGLGLGVMATSACVDPYESRLNQKCFADEHCDEGQFCEKAEGSDEGFCRMEGESMSPTASDSTDPTAASASESDTMDPTMTTTGGTTGGSTDGPTTNPTDPTDPTDASGSTSGGTGTDTQDETTGEPMGCQPQVAEYGAPQTYDVGANPQGLAVGDVDGDGSTDVVVGSRDTNAIQTWLGNGVGGLNFASTHNVNGQPTLVALGAIADAAVDVVVVADTLNQFVRARGDGAGGFAGNEYYDGALQDFVLVDVDDDGVLDLVTPGMGTLETRLGSPLNETFGNPIASNNSPATTVNVGDLDDDGVLDIVWGHYTGQAIGAALGTGNGSFIEQPNMAAGGLVRGVATGHFDGDDMLDLAYVTAGQGSDALRIASGQGDGTFAASPEVLAAPTTPWALDVGDLDSDGDDDVVVASQSGQISIYIQEADGMAPAVVENCGGNLRDMALADLDKDCVLDVVVVDSTGDRFCVFLSQ